jgi:hypothetical protein
MSKKAGALLWRRMRITLQPGVTGVDTGLTQLNKSFADQSSNEPPLGVVGVAPPPPGTLPASRIEVMPLAPTAPWTNITHSDPFFDPTTETIVVAFTNGDKTPATINVLFWDPHTIVGPGQADPYTSGNIQT